MRRRRRILVLVGLALLALFVVRGSLVGNVVTGDVGDRRIVAETANVLRTASLVISESEATVTLGDLQARVTPERVELAGGGTVPIPDACRQIELVEREGRIRVKLDGVEAN